MEMSKGILLKVAFQGSLGFGGLGTVTRELAANLAKHVDVTVFDVLRSFQTGLSLPEVRRVGISDPTALRRMPVNLPFQALGFRTSDLVHVNYASYGISALMSNQISRLPYVETVHGIPQPEFENGYDKLGYVAEQWALRLTAKRASAVVADSDYICEELRKRFSIRSTKINLGVDIERFFPPTADEVVAARDRLGIRPTERVVLYAGRLTPWKDPLTLVRAAGLVARENKDVIFHLVGRGPLLNEVLRTAKLLKVQDKVTVATNPDYLHGLADYYKAADIFVLPTRKEGFGLVVLEAMASGLCVIASDGGAPRELLGQTGEFFKTRDHFSLATAILNMLSNDSFRQKLGANARARAVERFRWEKCARSYIEIYQDIMGKG
jgi:glycosyltransferase involved in cell wall biosynthesis